MAATSKPKARLQPDTAGRKRVLENQQRRKQVFLEAYRNTGIIRAAALAAGVSRFVHYDWLKNDAEFAQQFDAAQNDALDALEAEARKRAFDGSDTLLIFLLKGAAPEKYRDRVSFDYSKCDDAELIAEGESMLARIKAARAAREPGAGAADDSAA